MFLFLKKKNDEPDRPGDGIPKSTPLAEFIPYFCHWDAHTLLTKNGEMMQTIRICRNVQGLDYESGDGTAVREVIRAAIAETVNSDKFALWIHTFRKRRRIRYDVKFKEPFAAHAHESWQNKHRWKHQYYNEIYVTLLREGQGARLFEQDALKHGVLLPRRNRQYRQSYLEEIAGDLERTAAALLAKLQISYDAQILSLVERERKIYSEPMEFLGQIVNLRSAPYPLSEADVSQTLAPPSLTFGFNALEVRSARTRRFAALLTIKQYREIPPVTADRVLQAPMEFIVSEAFSFIPSAKALKPYKEQKNYFEMSGDEHSVTASGLADMLSSDKGKPVDYGEHQTNIMVLADDYKRLDSEIALIQDGFSDVGLIAIREDIMLEECFWSQLPGNFEFLRRKSTINTSRTAGFTRLNRFALGNEGSNHWGHAVTMVPTIVGSPYFFNFHRGDNGHTVLFDFNSFNDTMGHTLLNFLLCETRKYDGKLCIFDRNQWAQLLLEKLDGKYHSFPATHEDYHPQHPPGPQVKLNPFTLPDDPRNRSFLLAWVTALMAPALTPTDKQKESLRTAIAELYAAAPDQRHLPALANALATADAKLAKALEPWLSGGHNSGIFDSGEDGFDPALPLHGFDMTPIAHRPQTIIPVFSYLLHRLVTKLDGRPAIIVIHEAFDLIENDFFAPRLESLLEMLKQHNAMMIFTTSKPFARVKARNFATIMQNCAMRLYIPDDVGTSYASEALGLTDSDALTMHRMERQKGEFLVKQGDDSTGLRIDLRNIHDLQAVFASDSKNLEADDEKWKQTVNP